MTGRRGFRSGAAWACGVVGLFALVFAAPIAANAASPSSSATITMEGTVHVVAVDGRNHGHETLLETQQHRMYRLRAAHAEHLKPNAKVRVAGTVSGKTITARSLTQLSAPATTAPTFSSGPHSVLVMLVYWTAPDGLTPESAETQIGSADNAWYDEVSYGQLSLTATATPWMQIAHTDCSIFTGGYVDIFADAEAGARARGFDPSAYDHEMVYFPFDNCGYVGLGEVSNRRTWINGVFSTRFTSHELGHNLGLGHADALLCSDPAGNQITLSDTCTHEEGRDALDVMAWGGAAPGSFNAMEKQTLGWMSGRVQTVSSDTTLTVPPLEQQDVGSGSQAVIVTTPTRNYWLEYRQPIGVDSFMDPYYPYLTDGVEVRVEGLPRYGPIDSELLDMRPGGDPFAFVADQALPSGSRFRTPDNVIIRVDSATSAGATVTIDFDAPPEAYAWDQPQVAAYTDATRAQTVDLTKLVVGQPVWVIVTARNAGTSTWLRDAPNPVLLGTAQPQDRPSRYFTAGWVGDNRAARVKEASVAPGERGTFEFPIVVPRGAGEFVEHFDLVAEHETWFPDINFSIDTVVLAPPGAPVVTETAVGDGWAIVAWNAPTDTGSLPLRYYTVFTTNALTQTPVGVPVSVQADATRANVRGLTNGTPYTFTVTATSDAGTGPASQPSGVATPTSKKVSFVTTWTATENARLVNASNKLHKSASRIQQAAVLWLADQLRANPLPGPTPVIPPSMVGPASYDTAWFASDQNSLLIVARQYALTPRETQKYATVKYLDSLSL
jgi:hypothetical protein